MYRRAIFLPASKASIAITIFVAGCSSISASVKSISTVASSPLISVSRSSSPEDSYFGDVRDVTAAQVKSSTDANALRREIAHVADKNGVSDWEQNENTYRGIGAGLQKAGLSQLDVEAFKRSFTETPEQSNWIQQGYTAD